MIETPKSDLKKYEFIDLFAGLGGFRIALENFGANCVFSSEWDKEVAKVYAENFGDHPHGDITKIKEEEIPKHDILCAGFPCQAFSISGKQKGFEDSRGTLFFDIARITKYHKPKVIFLENVKNLVRHDGGKTLRTILNLLEELGYSTFTKILNAANYGIPQKRERLYIVAFRKDLNIAEFVFPKERELKKHLEDYLLEEKEIEEKYYIERGDIRLSEHKVEEFSCKPIRVGIINKGGQGERIYSPKGTAITFSAYGGGDFAKTGGYLVNGRTRKLHPRECARVMGFPDQYTLAENDNHAYKQLGNSVVIDVVQLVAEKIVETLKKGRT